MSQPTLLQQSLTFLRENLFLVTLIIICSYMLSNYFQKGLYKIPGPWTRKFTTLPRIISVYKGKSHEDDIRLHDKYGKIVRLAPNLLSISDTDEIKKIYGIGTNFYKSRFYELSSAHDEEGLIPDTFILTDRALHTRMKRNAANAYSLSGLVQMEPWIEPVTERLLRMLETQATQNQVVDMSVLLKNYAMDAVFALTFGRDFNYLEKGDILGIYRVTELFSDYMAVFGQIPWTHKFLLANKLVLKLVLGGASSENDMLDLASTEIKAYKSRMTEDGSLTFLQRLLLNQQKSPESINDREVLTHAFGNVSAGSDTTAIALRSVIYHILKYPDVYAKLCEEVRGNLTLPVKFSEANKLPYLSAVIQEALRLHPSVGMVLARVIPAGGAILCGYNLPAGVEVGMNPWVLHRDSEVFPYPDKFWPERWLPSVSDEDHLKQMNRSFFSFGHGEHTCSGRWISLMEVTKVIPSLLLQFDLELVNEGKEYSFKNRWFTPQKGLLVRFKKL